MKNLAFLVGSDFCLILSQRERRNGARRAMIAPATSVGEVAKPESKMIEKYYDR